tara:strand:+ start:26 stop:502 length:477 start_codon:yes stop_codon:yes gene_type:complete
MSKTPDTSHLPPGAAADAADADAVDDPGVTITDLLPAPIAKKLSKAGIETVDDLSKTTQAKLSAIPRFGKTSLSAVLALAEDNNVTIPKGVVKKAPKKAANGSSTNGLTVEVTVALVGEGVNLQLCASSYKPKKGASLYDSATKALEHTKKVAVGLPD